jgi:plastocyanin
MTTPAGHEGSTDVSDAGGRTRWIVLAVLVPLVVVGALVIGAALRGDDDGTGISIGDASEETVFDYDFTIPAGTGDRIAAGEDVAVVPAELEVKVGESIRIVNQDDQDHYVGVFFVAAGETMRQTFRSAGELENLCTVHSSGSFTLRVVDA